MIYFGYNVIYKSLRKQNVTAAPKKAKIFIDPQSWEVYVHDKIEKLKDDTKQIDVPKFMKLVGAKYCVKNIARHGGQYYIDNVEINYDEKTLNMNIKYDVVHWDANGNPHRMRPARQ